MAYRQIEERQWKTFKTDLRTIWSDIKEEELEKTNRRIRSIRGLLEEKIGMIPEEARQKFQDLVERHS